MNSGARHRLNYLLAWCVLNFLGGVATVYSLLSAPSDPKNAWLLGYSRTRLLLAGAVLVALAALGWVIWRAWRDWAWAQRITDWLTVQPSRNWRYLLILVSSALILAVGVYAYVLSLKFTDALMQARLARLAPILLWLAFAGAQTIFIAPLIRYGRGRYQFGLMRQPLLGSLLVLAGLLLLALFVTVTRHGLTPDRTGWDDPGVPLLPRQVFMAWAAALFVFGVVWILRSRWRNPDFLIALCIWGIAAFAWWSVPLRPTYFSPTPRAPNFEYYPYSDAGTQDVIAQNLLLGVGYRFPAEKPLYSLFLATLHLTAGQNYSTVVAVQVALLALFPALVFLLGRQLGGRLPGLIVAGLLIFRERNSLALSGDINVSHSKLLMTDLPTAFALAVIALLLVVWLRRWRDVPNYALLIGGGLGLVTLLRSQVLLLAPIPMLLLLVIQYKKRRLLMRNLALFTLGLALVVTPWMLRNYLRAGRFGYVQTFQGIYIAKQYSLTPEVTDTGLSPDVSGDEIASQGFSQALAFARQYPAEVARFISAHFLHNEISSLLALPSSFTLADNLVSLYNLQPYWEGREAELWQQCCSLHSFVQEAPYWNSWDGVFPRDALLPISFNLVLVAFGIAVAWKGTSLIGLIPLLMHLAYTLSTSIARVSGWRLILPVDWVLLLYFAVGLGYLSLLLFNYLTGGALPSPLGDEAGDRAIVSQEQRSAPRPRLTFALAAGLLLTGMAFPLADIGIPARFTNGSLDQALDALDTATAGGEGSPASRDFADDPLAVAIWGRAFYPRYYGIGRGEPGSGWPSFTPRDYRRLAFYLVGPQNAHVVFPSYASPAYFPNAADVLVLGCQAEGYVHALAIILLESGQAILPTQQQALTCEALRSD